MRLQNLIKRMMPVVMAVMVVLLAACGQTAASPTPARPTPTSTPTKAPTPVPTPTPTQQPIPTVPVSQASPLQQELAREFGEWGLLVRAPKKASIYGSGGSAYINPGDLLGIYKIQGGEFDGKFLVADEGGSWTFATADEVKGALGFVPENAPSLTASDLKAHIQHAKAWATYREHWQAPQYIDGLVDQNGKPVDLQRFFTDRAYAVRIVSYYLSNVEMVTPDNSSTLGYSLVHIGHSNKDPNKIVDALYALYYGMRFDPDINMFGMKNYSMFTESPKVGPGVSYVWCIGKIPTTSTPFTAPFIDNRGSHHTNIDIAGNSRTVIYSPFTQPVKVENVWFWYDRRKFKTLEEAYEAGALNASIVV